MKTNIYLGRVTVSSVQQNAGIFYGENHTGGWKTSCKFNAALGRINGDGNVIASRLNLIHDPDVYDMRVEPPGSRTPK